MAAPVPPPPLSEAPLAPGLYLVSTPIGNLRDITLRALDVLAHADLVLAEDTRVSAKLLNAYGLKKRLQRYDDHIAETATPQIVEALERGERVALVSDAGAPLVSDPGYRLVQAAIAAGCAVFPIPGASAVIAALAVAGLPTDRFLFAGFPPPKSAARKAFLADLAAVRATLVFFEGASRVGDSLRDMAAVFGDRPAAVARELTKLYETTVRGDLTALAADPALQTPKGEIVILVGPGAEKAASAGDVDAALSDALERGGVSEAAAEVSRMLGLPRRDLYRRALELQGRS